MLQFKNIGVYGVFAPIGSKKNVKTLTENFTIFGCYKTI